MTRIKKCYCMGKKSKNKLYKLYKQNNSLKWQKTKVHTNSDIDGGNFLSFLIFSMTQALTDVGSFGENRIFCASVKCRQTVSMDLRYTLLILLKSFKLLADGKLKTKTVRSALVHRPSENKIGLDSFIETINSSEIRQIIIISSKKAMFLPTWIWLYFWEQLMKDWNLFFASCFVEFVSITISDKSIYCTTKLGHSSLVWTGAKCLGSTSFDLNSWKNSSCPFPLVVPVISHRDLALTQLCSSEIKLVACLTQILTRHETKALH